MPLRIGERLLVRFIDSSSAFIHPMHIRGGPFTVVATDGDAIPEAARYEKGTLNVAPGERYDVIWTARQPGKWLLHCHFNHHVTNDNVEEEGGGGAHAHSGRFTLSARRNTGHEAGDECEASVRRAWARARPDGTLRRSGQRRPAEAIRTRDAPLDRGARGSPARAH